MAKDDTFEVWLHKVNEHPDTGELSDTWHQILDGEDPAFPTEKRAMAVGGRVAQRDEVIEVVVIRRSLCMRLNGPSVPPSVPPATQKPKKPGLALVKGGEGKGPRSPMISNTKKPQG